MTVCHVIVPNWSPTGSVRTRPGRWPCPPNQRIWVRLRISGAKEVRITLQIVKRHPAIKCKLIESPTAAWNRGVTYVHLLKLPIQFRHNAQSDYKQRLAQNILTRQVNVKVAFWGPLHDGSFCSRLILMQLWWTTRHFYEVSIYTKLTLYRSKT